MTSVEELINKLKGLGYIIPIPILIHPNAYVSESSSIGVGSVVEPHSAIHINAGTIVKSRSVVKNKTKIDSGHVFG